MSLSKPTSVNIVVKEPIFPTKNAFWHFLDWIKGSTITLIQLYFEGSGSLADFFEKMAEIDNANHRRTLHFVWMETKHLDIKILMGEHVAYTMTSREADIRKICADTLASLEVPPSWTEKNDIIAGILRDQAQRCLEVALLKPRFLIE